MAGPFTAVIRGELRNILLRVPDLPRVSWQMRPFRPVAGTPWVREEYRPAASTLIAGGGRHGTVREDWLYLLDVFYPKTAELAEIDGQADAIQREFRVGTSVPALVGGSVTQSQRASLQDEPEWLFVPVSISGYVYRRND